MISPITNRKVVSYIDNTLHTIWMEDGVIIGVYHPDLKFVNIDIARKLVHERKMLCNGKTYPILANVRNLTGVTSEVKAYFSSEEARELGSACAIVVNNPLAKLLANFYTKVCPPKEAIKLFTDRKKAFNWIKQFRSIN